MFNYFKKIFTGYSLEKRRMDGVDFNFFYSDKPVFFDPQGMIRELKARLNQAMPQTMLLNLPFSEPLSNLPFPEDSQKPNVICVYQKSGREVKVSRFSIKDGIYPLSFYRFELDGTLIGTFRRKYDYGSQLDTIAETLAELNNSDLDLSKGNWLWENQEGAKIYLEKFGHSQCWAFENLEFLEF